jgi:hypothetical protein
MKSHDFRNRLTALQRPTRELVLEPGDPGPEPITKIAGVPWWPTNRPRPQCRDGHEMSFVCQVRLCDVPGLQAYHGSLLSFHYCLECSYRGKMSWGWEDPGEAAGYEVALLPVGQGWDADRMGGVAEPIVDAFTVRFRDVLEVPLPDDLSLDVSEFPDDYPQVVDDLDENIYPGLSQVARSKIGGWPHWVQNNAWPPVKDRQRVEFVGQLDWMLCPRSPWCNGGYVYLFVLIADGNAIAGEMALQTM